MIHLIQGDGKGKTSAAVGMAVRANGHGWPVLFMQFLKDGNSGEISLIRSISGIDVVQCPVNYGFTFQMTKEQLVLDEVVDALNAGLVIEKRLRAILEKKDAEIVLTGRNAPEWLVEKADYVSEVVKRKHPYDNGVQAREGIEY